MSATEMNWPAVTATPLLVSVPLVGKVLILTAASEFAPGTSARQRISGSPTTVLTNESCLVAAPGGFGKGASGHQHFEHLVFVGRRARSRPSVPRRCRRPPCRRFAATRRPALGCRAGSSC